MQPKAPKVKCPHCLEEISKGATRCKWCTSQLDPENVLPAPNMGKEVPAKTSNKDKVGLSPSCYHLYYYCHYPRTWAADGVAALWQLRAMRKACND